MLQSLHIVINMSPTGEGAVSLSLDKVHAKRDCRGAERWAGGGGGARAGRRTPSPGKGDRPGRTELVFRPGLSDGWFLAVTGSHFTPLLCVSTGKVGSEMLQGTGAAGLGDEAPAAQQRGGILVTWSEKGRGTQSPGTASERGTRARQSPLLLSGQTSGPELRGPASPPEGPGGVFC